MGPKKVEERNLQAVVLCDSYLPRFQPLTAARPRCLLPLANTPLIEYTLEFLVSAGVREVYLMCCAHADQVEEYISKKSKWNSPYVPFKLHVIALPNSLSVGDAMRDLDARGVIKSDFLLISGDVVCNVDFEPVWDAHVRRKREDKNCIMSVVLRQAAAMHRTRSRQTGLFVVDNNTGRLVGYKKSVLGRQVGVDATELLKLPAVAFRNDLIDCRIDICTVDVPALFTENFDYEHLRNDFVTGILNSDLLGKTIYAHILTEGYAARVESFKTYKAVSKDIVGRYSYPLVVDANEMSDQTYRYHNGHIYTERDVALSQSCIIGRQTVVAGGTSIGADTQVVGSVIGRNCQIGDRVVLRNAYLMDNVIVEEGVQITNSIVGAGAVIGSGADIQANSVIGFGSRVASKTLIEPNTLLPEPEDDDEERPWVDEPEDARFQDNLADFVDAMYLSDSSIEFSEDDNTNKQRSKQPRKKPQRSLSTASARTDDGLSANGEDDDDDEFLREAVASINRSIVDKHTQDVAILELNTLRMTMNAPHEKVQMAAVHALVSHIGHLIAQVDVKSATTAVFEAWTPLLKRITFDREGQIRLMTYIEEECAKRTLQGDKILVYALMTLYDTDLLEEEAIYEWWRTSDTGSKVRTLAAQWIEWLENAEEESD